MHRASTDMTPRLYTVRLRFPPLELVAVRRVRPPPPRAPYGYAEGDGRALAVALAAALAAAESSVVKDLSTIAATTSTGAGGSLKVLPYLPRTGGAPALCAAGVGSCKACTTPAAQGAIRRCGRGRTCTGCCTGCCTSRCGIISGKGFVYHCCNYIHSGWRKLEGLVYLPSQLLRLQQSHPKHDTHDVRLRALHVVPLVAGQRLPNRVLFGISRVV